MSYLLEKQKSNRQSVTIIEIDLDICDVTKDFSSDPESFNTPKTTIAPDAFSGDKQTYIFSDQQLGFNVTHFPYIKSISSTPAILKPGDGVSLSASATLVLTDKETNDVFALPPPYDDRRVKNSSFLGLLLARNYLTNREVRVKRGYNPNSLDDSNFQTEHYVIKSVGALDANGNLTINLIDRMFFTTETKAKAPVISDCIILGPLTDVATTVSFKGTSFGDKAKDRALEVGDKGFMSIGSEILTYGVTSFNGANGVVTLTRGEKGSSIEEHESLSTMQGCFITQDGLGDFGAENITDINRRLIRDFADIGGEFIDDAVWDNEKAGNLSQFNFTNLITSPTEISKLIESTIKSSGAWLYFDTILNEAIIGSSARFDLPVSSLNEDVNILKGSMKVTPDASNHFTRASIRHGKINYSEGDDENNYSAVFEKIDDIAESDREYGKQVAAKEIKSDWLTASTTDVVVANSIPQLKVEQYRDIPNKFTFELDSVDVGNIANGNRLWFGSVVEVTTRQLINANGSFKSSLAQVLSVKKQTKEDTWQITALGYKANIPTNVDLYIDTDKVDYVLSEHLVTDEAREYVVVINSSVRITASDTNTFAFDFGSLFAGCSVKLINQGYIVPASGKGGDGGLKENSLDLAFPPSNGSDGGDGLNITVETIIDNLSGLIAGGGGGGGGGNSDESTTNSSGGGGGGGAGDVAGAGGQGARGADFGNDGESGSFNFPGKGGAGTVNGLYGGTGGDLGQNGATPFDGAVGGLAGVAITKNGNTLTILSGNNTAQIKGAIV